MWCVFSLVGTKVSCSCSFAWMEHFWSRSPWHHSSNRVQHYSKHWVRCGGNHECFNSRWPQWRASTTSRRRRVKLQHRGAHLDRFDPWRAATAHQLVDLARWTMLCHITADCTRAAAADTPGDRWLVDRSRRLGCNASLVGGVWTRQFDW